MQSMIRNFAGAVALLSAGMVAHAESPNCSPITTLPLQISTPGVYCLQGNLTSPSAVAITIFSSDVVLDLNGYTITGPAVAAASTQAAVLAPTGVQRVTVRNGQLRGFQYGIELRFSKDILIEEVRVHDSYMAGIRVLGDNVVVRKNIVTNTGMAADGTRALNATGIQVSGTLAQITDNVVLDTLDSATSISTGISAGGAVIERNTVRNTTLLPGRMRGIWAGLNGMVIDNRLGNVQQGIVFSSPSATGVYKGNLVSGSPTPFTFGTAVGSTNVAF